MTPDDRYKEALDRHLDEDFGEAERLLDELLAEKDVPVALREKAERLAKRVRDRGADGVPGAG